jgi:hypothetical protein
MPQYIERKKKKKKEKHYVHAHCTAFELLLLLLFSILRALVLATEARLSMPMRAAGLGKELLWTTVVVLLQSWGRWDSVLKFVLGLAAAACGPLMFCWFGTDIIQKVQFVPVLLEYRSARLVGSTKPRH